MLFVTLELKLNQISNVLLLSKSAHSWHETATLDNGKWNDKKLKFYFYLENVRRLMEVIIACKCTCTYVQNHVLYLSKW